MAGTRTVAQFRNGVVCVAKFGVFTGFIIIGMACRTIRRECGVWIRHRLRIASVTIKASEWLRMRSRIVCGFMQIVQRGHPRRRAMTIGTFNRCHEMIDRFAGGSGAIVTGAAISGDAGVIECRGQPRERLVTITAICRRRNMGRRFARCFCAIMAARAGSKRLTMVHTHRRPRGCYMAAIAAVRRSNVVCVLARSLRTVVAAGTCTDRADMGEGCGRPSCRAMAIFTYI